MPKCMLLLVCALAIAVLTRAQEPFRFMDINQQASPSQGPSAWLGAPRWVDVDYHSGPTQALGRLPKVLGWHYFVVNYGELGAELWRTLGTSASTELVIDLREGGQGSLPRDLVPVGQQLLLRQGPSWPSTTSQRSTDSTSDGRTRSSRSLLRRDCGIAERSPQVLVRHAS